jgi:hypothetical protein
MNIDLDALVSAVVAKTDSGNRVKKEYLSSKIFKFEAPNPKDGVESNTYIVKLLPWTKDGAEGFHKTYVYRYQYRWQGMPEPGKSYGKWNYVTSAGNIKEACPIDEWRNEFLRANSGNNEEIKRVLAPLNRNEVRIMNMLMVDDPQKPENNGKVFPVELNKALWDIVDGALHGQLDEHFSEIRGTSVKVAKKVFDLSPEGMNLRVKVTLNNGGIPQYSKSEMCFAKADLFGERGITPSPEDKVTMLEKGKSLKEIIMERIENDMIDPTEIVKDSIRPYADVKKLFAKTFLSNPKISMHVSAAWMSDEEKVAPKVVPTKEETHENTAVEDEYELDSSDASVPTFAESNDMDDFMAELEAEQMGL